VLLALAIWSKQQGVFYLPLVVALLVWRARLGDPVPPPFMGEVRRGFVFPLLAGEVRRGFRFAIGLAVGVLALLVWDIARGQVTGQTSLFALAAANNNPERALVGMDELLPRLGVWLSYAGSFFGPAWWTASVVAVGIASLTNPTLANPVNREGTESHSPSLPHLWGRLGGGLCVFHERRRLGGGVVIALYTLAYFTLHWIFAFNLYDRYLLPIIPLLAVICGHGLARLLQGDPKKGDPPSRPYVAMILIVLLAISVPLRYPTDTRARDSDIMALAAYLNAKPLGAIVYDHWLGWEMGYYIGAWSDKRRVYYPDPVTLANDALLNPDTAPRYLIAPVEQEVGTWVGALRANGFTVTTEPGTPPRYQVWQIIPPR
jgi:hypothetical protein